MSIAVEDIRRVVRAGICTGCGACVALDSSGLSHMRSTPLGPVPEFPDGVNLPDFAHEVCPAIGIDYPALYRGHYGGYPESWLTGHIEKVRAGFARDPALRRAGASGGVLTRTLLYLLETGRVDGVILARQGVPTPEEAGAVIATTPDDVIAGAGSIYIPVSMLHVLRDLEAGKRYAATCLPEQSAALRVMQQNGFAPARQVEYVVGPYTGTALYPAAIRCYLRSKRVSDEDTITSLRWRAGEWPGYLEVTTAGGRVLRTPKVYYNFLIPFFVTQTSLQSMDFTNEFADLSVGDAWSPALEARGGGHSVVATRSTEMDRIIVEMQEKGMLELEEKDPAEASDMHGHMLDFKKRGGWLRNRWRTKTGRMAPDYGYKPAHVPVSRILVEVVVSGLFAVGRTRLARWLVSVIPESIIGPVFNSLRLGWKEASRPTKRKGLFDFKVEITS
jgi:coenzyme F420 hydrogenase subunit beta